MAILFPPLENIRRLTTPPTPGELHLVTVLSQVLDDHHEVFFNPFLDGDRPDVIVLKKGCGAAIIEVKDWNLESYRVDAHNKWSCDEAPLLSPHKQVFRYKKRLFDLHLPVLGLHDLTDRNFFRVVRPFVYFHVDRKRLERFYAPARTELAGEIDELNRRKKNGSITDHGSYEKKLGYLQDKRGQLSRDEGMSWARDSLERDVRKVSLMKKDDLFTDEIYADFKRRLAPPTFVVRQGVPVVFDADQRPLTASKPGLSKIRGVAGCGKTTILAQRAINAYERHRDHVLILYFNITLGHFIRDAIGRQLKHGADTHYRITHLHGLISSTLDELGIHDDSRPNFETLDAPTLGVLSALIHGDAVPKFKTILIDETQDYELDWIQFVKDRFLAADGELTLFGDRSQNIYDRKEQSALRGFGRWQKLTRSYRSGQDARLVKLLKGFHERYLAPKDVDSEIYDVREEQASLIFDLLTYQRYGSSYDASSVLSKIREYIRVHELHPNDVAIIASRVDALFPLNEELTKTEKTKISFEDGLELDEASHGESTPRRKFFEMARQCEGSQVAPEDRKEFDDACAILKGIRRRKKVFFFQNSGVLKLSTTHSFKGHEAETVFCILMPDDSPEIVYTGITRARRNLVIFDAAGSKFESFFLEQIESGGEASPVLKWRIGERRST
ncbi:nuclease-related domain-containing DEAD/DEAH box helicase [Myxococcus sp. RHSTA-1-4]|uniref:nuclease-related domain-containing DEAD/DEAH box helicase n=1 Tax=Myxococcus sp. RHSTA-1-4 TaxID=2874601 RepID=UPI001CBA96DC|nr:NERD domain-containing protein [Myxococcus sp. RHSTA-1-4]MBZ4416845.1 AAA family ATPase [Myxococcus sp. RHSTA-1-4]